VKKLLTGFALALSMLTTLPFFRVHDFFRGINGYAVMSYPLVGALLGGILLGLFWLLQPCFPETHLKILLFFLWIVLTGALHLDGFADTVDGLFVPAERAEAVMKDPHNGGMGMIFTGGFLLLKASALWHLEALWALPLLLMLARYNAVAAIWFYPYIRNEGMGSLAKAELTRMQMIAATVLVAAAALFTLQGWMLLLGSVVTLWLVARFVAKRLGGFSGDIYGFLIEVSEVVLLHLLIVGAAL
jgi:cobalamin 5'-phosphate synthase/cobalamin synthase